MTLSTQHWVNFTGSASAQYPTDGAGGVTTTIGSSAFASGNKWAGKAARVVAVEINDRPAGAGTVAIKDHAGTATYKTIGTGTAALYSDESNTTRCGIGGIVIPIGGLSVVASDSGIGGTVYFEVEVIP